MGKFGRVRYLEELRNFVQRINCLFSVRVRVSVKGDSVRTRRGELANRKIVGSISNVSVE